MDFPGIDDYVSFSTPLEGHKVECIEPFPIVKLLYACYSTYETNLGFVFSGLKATGLKEVSECAPSQKGWCVLAPQAHHIYVFPGMGALFMRKFKQ